MKLNQYLPQILESPTTYGFTQTSSFCPAYASVVNDPSVSLAACGAPLSSYFWWNSYHPSFEVQKLIAEGATSAPS